MTGLSGKLARLQTVIGAATVNHEFENWDLGLKNTLIPANGFEKVPDADGEYWETYLSGLRTGDAQFEGLYNSAKTPTNSFKPGTVYSYASLFCGLTAAIGFTLTGKCESIGISTRVENAGRFKGSFKVEGVTTYPS